MLMDHPAETIVAEFNQKAPKRTALLNVKGMYQAGIKELSLEIKKIRKNLGHKLWKARKRARDLAYKRALKKAELEINTLLETAKTQYDKCVFQANKDCLDLSLAIAESILLEEIKGNTKSLAKRIQEAAAKLVSIEVIDIAAHSSHCIELSEIFTGYPEPVKITADDSLERGNAVIKTDCGEITLNWKTQLEIMRNLLLSKIRQAVCP